MQPIARNRELAPSSVIFVAVLLLLLAAVAFSPQYLARPFANIDLYTHAHAAVGLLWLITLIAQSSLIRAGDRSSHRALGRVVYLLGPAFIVSSVLLAHYRFSRMPLDVFAQEAYSLYLPLSMASLFALALGLGLRWRRVRALHSRFMVATAVLFIDPVLGRILFFYFPPLARPWVYQAITFSIIVGLLGWMYRSIPGDMPNGRVFSAFLATAAATLLLWFFFPRGPAWLAFATWFRSLPIT